MLITQTESTPRIGKTLIGKLMSGVVSCGNTLHAIEAGGKVVETARILRMIKRYGTSMIEVDTAHAGDIVSLTGFTKATVGHTINSLGMFHVIPVLHGLI